MAALPPPTLPTGRKRARDELDNRRGRWHGLVYVEVPRTRALVAAAARATGLPPGDLCRDAHVSLSKPFGLYRHEVEPFLARLRARPSGRVFARYPPVLLEILRAGRGDAAATTWIFRGRGATGRGANASGPADEPRRSLPIARCSKRVAPAFQRCKDQPK